MNWKKRVTSFVLVVCMLVGSIPTMAFATEQQGTEKSHSSASVPFTDVDMNSWYGEAVQYVYDNHLMSGTSRTTFEPNTVMSRAMVVQILYNKTGKPAVNDNNSGFTDVSKSDWYSKAVAWAYQNGYASGVGNNRFEPNANVTREQFAQFMYNYTGKPETQIDVLSQFPDGSGVTWSKNAMTWAVSNKIINGSKENGVNYLRPQDSATRAQAAVILKNYCAMEKQQARFAILDLTVQGQKATVQVTASSVCTLTIQFLDENTGNELNTSATTFVPAGTEMGEVTADITGNMLPSHYKAVITLTDSKGDRLCNEFTSMKYTTAQEKFDAETVDDFPDKNVINFDEDKTDNFGVLADDVKIPTVADNTNIIEETSDDTYTVKNIDSSVNALGKGDEVLFYDENGEEVLVSIENIKVSGTTATITRDDTAYLTDFYDVLKVDEEKSIEQSSIDMSGADDGVTLVKQDARQKSAESGNVRADNENGKAEISQEVEFALNYQLQYLKIGGSLKAVEKLEIEIKYDKKLFGEDYFYFKIISKTSGSFSIEITTDKDKSDEKQKKDLTLCEAEIPIGAGFSCTGSITLPVEFKLQGTGKVEAKFEETSGFCYSTVDGYQDITGKNLELQLFKVEGKAELKMGPKLSFSVEFMKDILKAEISAQIGADATAKVESPSIDISKEKPDSIHGCTTCIDGDISLFADAKAKLTYHITKKWEGTPLNETLLKINVYLTKAYVSLVNDDNSTFGGKVTLGWGECPNKKYKTTFRVIDGNGKEVKNISISIQRNDEKQYTAQSSKPIYLYDGEYTASCVIDNTQVQQDFKVDKGASTITLKAVPYIASGKCGDNLTWTLDQNGLLHISGTGAMYGYEDLRDNGWWNFSEDIKSVYIDSGVTTIDSNAFMFCSSLENVTIPGSVEKIPDSAFLCCYSLENVEIQNGVKRMGSKVFQGCKTLKNVEIPSSVDEIDANPFDYCINLIEVHVDERNSSYCSEDGVLFNKEKTHLICYPIGKPDARYVVPDGVIEIGEDTFYYSSLTDIQIPNSVTTIENGAFDDCDKLSDVYYEGNEKEWSTINIDENNEPLTSATIHYNS